MLEIWPEEHPNMVKIKLIDPMFAALGDCISGENINAVEDWWLEKIKHDITYQRFKIHGASAVTVKYENQYMVKHYFDNVHRHLPSLTGTTDEMYEKFRKYPKCEFGFWWDIQVKEFIGKAIDLENSFWRSLRTPEEIEMNKHPNRSHLWVPNRIEVIKNERKFYFANPDWTQEDDKGGPKMPFEYISPFSYGYKNDIVGFENIDFNIGLRNPTTNVFIPPLFSSHKGLEKPDLDADAYVEIMTIHDLKSEEKTHLKKLGFMEDDRLIKVTKPFMNRGLIYEGEDEWGVECEAVMYFGILDIQKLKSGEIEGGRLFPFAFQLRVFYLDVVAEKGVNYYSSKSRLGLLNWIKL